ncbi:uncharacterized protein [Anabrus simplex]|uniref:uncharacterized protein n=1 Tax=Anabrus simplex TaxID=316456 RepID=UPI0035A26CA5
MPMDPACLEGVVQDAGASVMDWGAFSWYGIGPLVVLVETLNVKSDNFIVNGEKVSLSRARWKLHPGAVPHIFPNLPKYLSSEIKSRKSPNRRKNLDTTRKRRKNIEVGSAAANGELKVDSMTMMEHESEPLSQEDDHLAQELLDSVGVEDTGFIKCEGPWQPENSELASLFQELPDSVGVEDTGFIKCEAEWLSENSESASLEPSVSVGVEGTDFIKCEAPWLPENSEPASLEALESVGVEGTGSIKCEAPWLPRNSEPASLQETDDKLAADVVVSENENDLFKEDLSGYAGFRAFPKLTVAHLDPSSFQKMLSNFLAAVLPKV